MTQVPIGLGLAADKSRLKFKQHAQEVNIGMDQAAK